MLDKNNILTNEQLASVNGGMLWKPFPPHVADNRDFAVGFGEGFIAGFRGKR
ncbi:hypothetical protein NFX39_02090 [Fructobacillus sp. W13]|uniref:Bacteriocin n=2 Tax=Fructobacillus apis TaxID=2935017 RepID=A0ABT0ZPH4_9LACO|nr:hypothetical protein [Fructobacillus apis]